MKTRRIRSGTPLTVAAALLTTSALLTARPAAAQPVYYYGGRVISNVEVVEVAWTSGVDPSYLTQIQGFYQTIVQSEFIDWMTEYDTLGKVGKADNLPGSNQHIGRGTFGSVVTITPDNTSTTLQDADLQTELALQLMGGKLPPPKTDASGNVNTIYMIEFPSGYSISLMGLTSCQDFGAYHFSITYDGMSVPYGVFPDCGGAFTDATSDHSHELAEAMTDMEQGQAVQLAPEARPVAWMTAAATTWDANEVADICVGTSGVVAGYTVQGVWSNFANACVTHIPICDGVLMPPQCRPCNAFDSGNACSGETPACATAGTSAGQCVACTTASPGACTGTTPICDDTSNTCVGCLTSADCKAPAAPVCDPMTETCRPCQLDSECPQGVCDVTGDVQKGECVACNADKDCAADQQCIGHTCAPDSGSGGAGAGGGGPVNPNKQGGCGCRAAPLDADAGALWLGVGLFAAAGARRRRATRRLGR